MYNVEINGPKILFEIPVLGGIRITQTVLGSWIVILIILVLSIILTRNLKKIPTSKIQLIAEKLIVIMDNLVISIMGESNVKYTPYIITLMASSILGSLISLIGLRSVTSDINTTMTWAVMTFLLIQISGITKKGGLNHFKELFKPIPFLFPLNVISELSIPISMGFRHFGNILSGMIISSLLYTGLAALTNVLLNLSVPLLQIGLPAILSLYFDLFSGFMQAFIFCMLTMVFVSKAKQ